MADTGIFAMNSNEQVTVEQLLAEMQRLRTQMDSDQEEIEQITEDTNRLKTETRAVLSELKAMVFKHGAWASARSGAEHE